MLARAVLPRLGIGQRIGRRAANRARRGEHGRGAWRRQRGSGGAVASCASRARTSSLSIGGYHPWQTDPRGWQKRQWARPRGAEILLAVVLAAPGENLGHAGPLAGRQRRLRGRRLGGGHGGRRRWGPFRRELAPAPLRPAPLAGQPPRLAWPGPRPGSRPCSACRQRAWLPPVLPRPAWLRPARQLCSPGPRPEYRPSIASRRWPRRRAWPPARLPVWLPLACGPSPAARVSFRRRRPAQPLSARPWPARRASRSWPPSVRAWARPSGSRPRCRTSLCCSRRRIAPAPGRSCSPSSPGQRGLRSGPARACWRRRPRIDR